MGNTGLIISIVLNVLLIVSTGILIWDKFKPKRTNINCSIQKILPSRFTLTIKNPNDNSIKISNILLNNSSLSEYQLNNKITPFPVILPSGNVIHIDLYSNLSKGQPTNCKVIISKKFCSKTIECSL